MFNLNSFLSEGLKNVKNFAKTFDLSEHDSEDVAAMVVADFFKKYSSGQVDVESNPQAYLSKLARWRITDRARRNIRNKHLFHQIGEENNLDELIGEQKPTDSRLKTLQKALSQVIKDKKSKREKNSEISNRDCEIFRQTMFEHRTAEELAANFKTTKAIVYLARHRVGKKVKELLQTWKSNSLF